MKVIHNEGPARRVILDAALKLGRTRGRVGWFESAKYQDGTPVAGVAYVQEHGSQKRSIPARPFFRPAADENEQAWAKYAEQLARAVMAGKMPASALFEALALMAEADVRKKITLITEPPLSLLTLQARKYRRDGGKVTGKTLGTLARQRDAGPPDVSGVSTKPLNDTGYMLATLTSNVEGP